MDQFSMLASLVGALAGANAAQGISENSMSSCPPSHLGLSCRLASLRGDLDGDGKDDDVEVRYDFPERLYFVHVTTSRGQSYHPFMAGHDPTRDRVSISYRNGWDYRCRNYVPGKECGYGFSSGYPRSALYLSDSRNGEFVLMLTFPHMKPNMKASDARFVVMPPLDGAPVDPR